MHRCNAGEVVRRAHAPVHHVGEVVRRARVPVHHVGEVVRRAHAPVHHVGEVVRRAHVPVHRSGEVVRGAHVPVHHVSEVVRAPCDQYKPSACGCGGLFSVVLPGRIGIFPLYPATFPLEITCLLFFCLPLPIEPINRNRKWSL